MSKIKVNRPFNIVRATVPLAQPLPWAPNGCPFVVRRADGSLLKTQWEKVATTFGGLVKVAEILAYDDVPGTDYTIEALATPSSATRPNPGPWAERFLDSPPLIKIDGALVPLTYGAFHRRGGVAVTRHFFGPHVTGWITVFDTLDVAHVELILHDADAASPEYLFSTIEIEGKFESAWPEPMLVHGDAWSTLVPAKTSGKHWVGQRMGRRWSGAIHNGTLPGIARMVIDRCGWGASDHWRHVAAWQAQGITLPDLAYRLPQLVGKCWSEWGAIKNALTNGTPFGMGATTGGRQDIWHPWGPPYGGVTGGSYRYQYEPIAIAAVLASEGAGILELQARLHMVMQRMHTLLLDGRGQPSMLEDWVDANGSPKGGWQISDTDGRFVAGRDGAFRFAAQPPPIGPPMERSYMLGFGPIDYQHQDRMFMPAVGLVWAENCPVAAWWLRSQAEVWRMNESGGADSVMSRRNAAMTNPGRGTGAGRAHGHGWALAAHAYTISDSAWKQRWLPYMLAHMDALGAAQMANGLFRTHWRNKDAEQFPFGDGTRANWSVGRSTEDSLLMNSLVAVGAVTARPVNRALGAWANSGVVGFMMQNGRHLPTYTYGVQRLTYPGPVIGAVETNPDAVPRDHVDASEVASPIGALLLYEPSSTAIVAALKLCGNTTNPAAARVWLRGQTLANLMLDDRAPLIAALDRIP